MYVDWIKEVSATSIHVDAHVSPLKMNVLYSKLHFHLKKPLLGAHGNRYGLQLQWSVVKSREQHFHAKMPK